jgi:hypothetical protein
MDDLQRIEISLPKSEKSQAWDKHEDRYFYFDEPNGCKVDMQRWGGGIPLLLSGPGAERRLFQNASDDKIAELGFNTPSLKATLTLTGNNIYNVEVGDSTPSGQAYYIRLAEYRDIYTVDISWYQVVERLITEPPYPPANFVAENITITPAQPLTFQTITITVQMANTGCVSGSYEAVLKINNVVEGTKALTLAGNAKETIAFTTTRQKPGTYSVTIGGKSAKLVVKLVPVP